VAAPPLGTMAAVQEADESTDKPKKMGCKITVVKRSVNHDLVEKYGAGREVQPCEYLRDGQEFMVEHPWNPPKGICSWAWADIRTYIVANLKGGKRPLVTNCTDGLRPVYFMVEPAELKS
jgi:uncharacterized repeat protein (TIGR04076 family)